MIFRVLFSFILMSIFILGMGGGELCSQELNTDISAEPKSPTVPPVKVETGPAGEVVGEPVETPGTYPKPFDVRIDPKEFPETHEDVTLQPEFRLQLIDCIQMALLNNKEIRATNYDVEKAEWKLNEAQPRGVPTIEYRIDTYPAPRDVENAVDSFFSGNVTFGARGRLVVGAPLYTFGKISKAQILATLGIGAEKQKRIQKRNEVVLKVKKLYFGILLARDVRELLTDAVKHLEEEIERRSPGEEPRDPVELSRLKLYQYEILSRLSKLEKNDYLANEGLRIQMGLPRGTDYEIVDKHLEPTQFELKDFEYYMQLSKKFRPKNRLLNIGLQAKEAEYELEKRKGAPDIGVGGFFEAGRTVDSIQGLQLTDDFNDPFNFSRAGVAIRINGKINPKAFRAKVRQKQAEYFKVAVSKSAADEGLELDLKAAYLDVRQNKKNLGNARQAMKTSRQYVFITKSNIDIGIGDKKDYSDALQAYLISRGRYLEGIYNYNIAVATLLKKIGGTALIK